MNIARSIGRLAPATIVAIVLWGCAATSPKPPSITAPATVSPEQISQLTQAIRIRDKRLLTLKSAAVMEYTSRDGHVKAREQILAVRPASLRVEASSPFSVALIVAVNRSRIEIFEPGKNLLMYGSANAATLSRFARIPMTPEEAVRLVMGLAPEPVAFSANPAASRAANGLIILAYRTSGGAEYENGFQNRELMMARARDADGRIRYEIRYTDYQDIGGMTFPYKIHAEFPQTANSLELSYEQPIVNAQIPATLFTLKPAPDTREVDLDQLHARTNGKSG